ncbi:hypothetical protein Tco_0640680, partial [Tanacetum coccineum]
MARDMATWLESPPYWLKSSEVGVYGKPVPKFTADYKNRFENQTITVSSSILLKLGVIEANKGMHEVNIISRAQTLLPVHFGNVFRFADALKDLNIWVICIYVLKK